MLFNRILAVSFEIVLEWRRNKMPFYIDQNFLYTEYSDVLNGKYINYQSMVYLPYSDPNLRFNVHVKIVHIFQAVFGWIPQIPKRYFDLKFVHFLNIM